MFCPYHAVDYDKSHGPNLVLCHEASRFINSVTALLTVFFFPSHRNLILHGYWMCLSVETRNRNTCQIMSHVNRKPVIGGCEHEALKPVCFTVEAIENLESFGLASNTGPSCCLDGKIRLSRCIIGESFQNYS